MNATWTYCRNCVAWREPLYAPEKDLCSDGFKVCRRYAANRIITSDDDGCCEGVAKVGKVERGAK